MNKHIKIIISIMLIAFVVSVSGCLTADADDDGYPDDVDDFPNDARYFNDRDGDGYADEVDELPDNSKYHLKADYYAKMIVDAWINEDLEIILKINDDGTCYSAEYMNLYQTADGVHHCDTIEKQLMVYEIFNDDDGFELILADDYDEVAMAIAKLDDYELILMADSEEIAFKRLPLFIENFAVVSSQMAPVLSIRASATESTGGTAIVMLEHQGGDELVLASTNTKFLVDGNEVVFDDSATGGFSAGERLYLTYNGFDYQVGTTANDADYGGTFTSIGASGDTLDVTIIDVPTQQMIADMSVRL